MKRPTRPRVSPWVEVSLGLDAGSKNFGWCAVDVIKVRPLLCGKLGSCINDLKPYVFQQQADAFTATIDRLITRFRVDQIIFERFQTRGFGGALIEHVSTMNGAATAVARRHGCIVLPTIASTWKAEWNAAQPRWQLERFYPIALEAGVSPHELDASIMGCWGGGVDLSDMVPADWLDALVDSFTNYDATECPPSMRT